MSSNHPTSKVWRAVVEGGAIHELNVNRSDEGFHPDFGIESTPAYPTARRAALAACWRLGYELVELRAPAEETTDEQIASSWDWVQ